MWSDAHTSSDGDGSLHVWWLMGGAGEEDEEDARERERERERERVETVERTRKC